MIDNENFGKLVAFLKEYRLIYNDSDLATQLDVSRGYISPLRKGDKFAIINKDWLLTGEGSMLRQERAGVISVPASGINTEGRGAKVYDIDATSGSQGRDMDMTTESVIGYVS